MSETDNASGCGMTQTAGAPVRSPEFELLCCCARREVGPAEVQRISALVRGGMDWDQLWGLAQRHRMVPLLYWHLNALRIPELPQDVLTALHRRFLANAGRVLQLTGELLDIVAVFEENAIPVVPYKGPALASQIYGNVALRHAGDIDILVRKRDVEAARELLLARGYRPGIELKPGVKALQLKVRAHEVFRRNRTEMVELHWAFTHARFAFPLTLEALSERLERVSLGSKSVPAFSSEDLLIILCFHGSKHCWERLEWICGVAELIRNTPDLDWSVVRDRARELGSGRMLRLGLVLARELLEVPVPPDILQESYADAAVPRLAAEVFTVLTGETIESRSTDFLARDLFSFRLLESIRARLRFLVYWLTTPNPQGWLLLPIGKRFVPVHALFVPARLLAAAISRGLRSLSRKPVPKDSATRAVDGQPLRT